MRAGSLRDRITIQRQTETTDDYGNTVGAWADLVSVWADVRETTGKEKVAAGRVEASRTATIRVRKSSATAGITEADRLTARGETWNIRSIAQADRKGVMLDLLCESGVST
ncbi:phage head closure protein [Limimaricola cinnabarinus]|uniref:phage head closure protein n=1 Tax=Limimaricola cinnabarinus TaxID=1125964 RepID=UPI0024916ED5|nr:phage head closure protein [Limimaricola cinnabarinus]